MRKFWILVLLSTFFWQAACYQRNEVDNQARYTVEQVYYKGSKTPIRTDSKEEYNYLPETTVYFEFNKYNIDLASQDKLKSFYQEVILKEPTAIFFVEGNTDSSGSQEYNMQLSGKRAEAVIKFLVYLGANSSQFSILARGELNPIADDLENPELNRRVIVYRKTRN